MLVFLSGFGAFLTSLLTFAQQLFTASIHVNETASVIKMRSLDNIVYEQGSQMALSCFHYDS